MKIELNAGEKFVKTLTNEDGHGYHLILLPGDNDDADWKTQMDWAANIGGELPDRVESALLFATLKDEFKPDWYWLRETHAAVSEYAWVQLFINGTQYYSPKSINYRARAVRRIYF